MRHTFEYMQVMTAMDSIDIEDIGSCCLRAFNDDGYEFWLLTKTKLGVTKIICFGPILADTTDIDNIEITFSTANYDEKRIIKTIEKWLSSTKRVITQVFESNEDEFKSRLEELDLLGAINEL